MTVVLPRNCRFASDDDRRAPLAVAGIVHGHPVQVLVTGLPEVLAQIAAWTKDDQAAIGCWGLRDDYSEPLVVPVRRRAGARDLARQMTHLVCLRPGEPHGGTLTAICGLPLSLLGVEVLSLGAGMPCELCLSRQVARDATDDGGALDGGLQRAIKQRLDRQIG